jgi:adenylate cyclase
LQPSPGPGILLSGGAWIAQSGMSEEHPQKPPSAPERESRGHQHGHSHLPKFTFVEELKRRNVGRVAILYIILGYVVLEVFGVFVHLLDLPPWVGRSAVLLVVLGFPVALLIAWIYEITPEGLKPTDEVAPHQSIRHLTGRRLDRAIIAVLAIALAYFVIDKFWLSKRMTLQQAGAAGAPAVARAAPAISDKSIAVLPFTDMSEKKDQEYFSEGLSEELINLLSKVPALHVPARTSSFYFKGRQEDIPTIARRLMVAHVLEGSVRKAGNHVRITVQLVRADNGYHLWSQTFDRTLDDIFKVQDEIATEVVRALKISLATDAVPRAAPSNNPEAHSLLLQAKFWDYNESEGSTKRAASFYQQAIALDPGYAEAWVGLSGNLVGQSAIAGQTWQHFRNLALHAAERAVALNPKLVRAHCALGLIHYTLDWDLVAANSEYAIALSLDAGSSCALEGAGLIAAARGQLIDALRLWEQSAARDPLNYVVNMDIAYALYAMGRVTEALATARKLEELDANASPTHSMLSQMLLATGRSNDALAEARRVRDPGYRAYTLARTYIVLGRSGDADAALADFEKRFSTEQTYNLATLHALRGDRDQAFSWLERAYQQHDSAIFGIPTITIDPDMKNLHSDPRWEAFLRKVKLLE